MNFLSRLLSKIIKDIGIDLGTANTIIFAQNRGYIINEPSVIAQKNGQLLKIGKAAKEMLGKTGKDIHVIRPLADGVIADFEAGEAMIKAFIKMADIPAFAINKTVIGVPTGITSVEKKAIIDSAESAGARKVFLVQEPMASAIGVGLDVLNSNANMIVDIGGGTTDIAVINYGGIVLDNTLRIASDEMNQAIQRHLKNRYHLKVGELTAERIKMEHGVVHSSIEKHNFAVKGLDLHTSLPRQIIVTTDFFIEALSGITNSIMNAVLATLDQLPPELACDLVDRGIILSGGGSLLRGLDVLLREKLNIPISRPSNALYCVAEGTRKILESFELYQSVLLK